MKYLILSALLICAFREQLSAQELKKSSIVIGAQVGAALSFAATSDRPEFRQRSVVRPTLGVYADIGNNHKLALRTGIAYLMMGSKLNYGFTLVTTKLNYLAVPVLLKVRPGGGDFLILGGGQVGFLTSAKTKAPFHWVDFKEECEKTDIAGTIGIGVEPKSIPVSFALTGQFSLNKVFTEMYGKDLRNKSIKLVVQYRIFGE